MNLELLTWAIRITMIAGGQYAARKGWLNAEDIDVLTGDVITAAGAIWSFVVTIKANAARTEVK